MYVGIIRRGKEHRLEDKYETSFLARIDQDVNAAYVNTIFHLKRKENLFPISFGIKCKLAQMTK